MCILFFFNIKTDIPTNLETRCEPEAVLSLFVCDCEMEPFFDSVVSQAISLLWRSERCSWLEIEMVGFGAATKIQECVWGPVEAIPPYQCWGEVQRFVLGSFNDGWCSRLQYVTFEISTHPLHIFFFVRKRAPGPSVGTQALQKEFH